MLQRKSMHRSAPGFLLTTPGAAPTLKGSHNPRRTWEWLENVTTGEQNQMLSCWSYELVKPESRYRASARLPEKLKSRRPGFGQRRRSDGRCSVSKPNLVKYSRIQQDGVWWQNQEVEHRFGTWLKADCWERGCHRDLTGPEISLWVSGLELPAMWPWANHLTSVMLWGLFITKMQIII